MRLHNGDGVDRVTAPKTPPEVGVYIDGYNLYYGGRTLVGGSGKPGWRWLDLRGLATSVVATHSGWPSAVIARVVYCTAPIDGVSNPGGARDQNLYLRALRAAVSVDEIEQGRYINKVITRPLAVKDGRGRPVLTSPAWPVMVQDAGGAPISDARSWSP
jgi:hypothetical protein